MIIKRIVIILLLKKNIRQLAFHRRQVSSDRKQEPTEGGRTRVDGGYLILPLPWLVIFLFLFLFLFVFLFLFLLLFLFLFLFPFLVLFLFPFLFLFLHPFLFLFLFLSSPLLFSPLLSSLSNVSRITNETHSDIYVESINKDRRCIERISTVYRACIDSRPIIDQSCIEQWS